MRGTQSHAVNMSTHCVTQYMHLLLYFGVIPGIHVAFAQQLPPFPTDTPGTFFSGVFTDRMVLQRSPTAAQVFGVVIGAEASTSVHVTISVRGEPDYSVTAHMVLTHKAGYMRWHAVLRPHAAGGNATITASCTSCQSPDNASAIHDVVFGDVWFCRCAWHVFLYIEGQI